MKLGENYARDTTLMSDVTAHHCNTLSASRSEGLCRCPSPRREAGTEAACAAPQARAQNLFADEQWRGPAGFYVGQHQRLNEAAARRRATVSDKIGLNVTGRRVSPISRRPCRNAVSQHACRRPTARRSRSVSDRSPRRSIVAALIAISLQRISGARLR